MSLENFGDEDIEIDDAASNKSVPESIKGSDVWKYFTRDVNFKENKKAKCNHCGIIYIFFFNDTATTEIYTLSLHDALPISPTRRKPCSGQRYITLKRFRKSRSSCRLGIFR